MQKFFKINSFGLIKFALINVMLFFYILLGEWAGMNILNVFVFLAFVFIEIFQKYIKKLDEQNMPIFEKFMSWAFIPLSMLLLLEFAFYPLSPSLLLMILWYFLYVLIIKTYFPFIKIELNTSKSYKIMELIIYIASRATIVFGFLICVIFLNGFNAGFAFAWVSYSFFLITSFSIAISYILLAIDNIDKIKHLAKQIQEKYKTQPSEVTNAEDENEVFSAETQNESEEENQQEESTSTEIEDVVEIETEDTESEEKKSTSTEIEDVVEVEIEEEVE